MSGESDSVCTYIFFFSQTKKLCSEFVHFRFRMCAIIHFKNALFYINGKERGNATLINFP